MSSACTVHYSRWHFGTVSKHQRLCGATMKHPRARCIPVVSVPGFLCVYHEAALSELTNSGARLQ